MNQARTFESYSLLKIRARLCNRCNRVVLDRQATRRVYIHRERYMHAFLDAFYWIFQRDEMARTKSNKINVPFKTNFDGYRVTRVIRNFNCRNLEALRFAVRDCTRWFVTYVETRGMQQHCQRYVERSIRNGNFPPWCKTYRWFFFFFFSDKFIYVSIDRYVAPFFSCKKSFVWFISFYTQQYYDFNR